MTPREQQLLKVIAADLQQDHSDYQRLLPALTALYEQMMQRNSQQIDLLNEQINELLEQSRPRAERRSKVLAALGLSRDHTAMQRLLSRYPQPLRQQFELQWQELGEWALQCKRQNERNGKLLAMQNEIITQLLAEPGSAQLYNPSYY